MQYVKKVLVTGASGFIGSRCLQPLIAKGYEVHAITSHPVPGASDARITWHRCDLLDSSAAAALIETVRASHLLHLAWIAVPGKFWGSPDNLRWLAAGITLVDAFTAAVGVASSAQAPALNTPGERKTLWRRQRRYAPIQCMAAANWR